jgi:decaprenylphospho-beta-D-erythro-pentofuranosid-2-ulose 2-reductase
MNDAFGHPQSVLVLGGTSDIADKIVRRFIADRCRKVVLAGRNSVALTNAAEAARAAGANVVETVVFDALEVERVEAVIAQCFEAAGDDVDVVVVAVGELGHQVADEFDVHRIAQMLTVNLTWPAAAMSAVAARLAAQGHGSIVVLSSVAGVRIRRANFLYGSAKAGLDAYAQGLAEAVRGTGVSVHIVRPGFVFTKMTTGLSPAPFAVDPDVVAQATLDGMQRGKRVIWAPAILGSLYPVLRALPRAVWRRLPG